MSRDGALRIAPCLPQRWAGYHATVHGPGGRLELKVTKDASAGGAVQLAVDERMHTEATVPFPEDGTMRRIFVSVPTNGQR